MKKKIFLLITLMVLTIVTLFIITQLENIKGIWYAVKYDKGQIESMISDADTTLKEDLEAVLGHSIREYTEEENELIESGNATEHEIIEKIVREEIEKSKKADTNDKVSMYITELYNLKGRYIGILDGMVKSAVSEYKALDKSQKTRSKQLEIGAAYVTKAMALESECDGKVAGIISKIEKELKADGKKTDIVNTINDAYKSEKTLKRAYYLNMFK